MTSIAQCAPRPAARRFTASLTSIGEVVLAAIEASRAIHTAHTPEARRVVLDRFASDSAPRTHRTAA
jgi:hypothetical protein